MPTTKPKIIIIGAGASGIAAATKLLENGFSDLLVLEAEKRIGGRVNSVDFAGSIVDLGGQWVHGEKGNIVYKMVKDLDLLSTSQNNYQDNTFYISNGKIVDKPVSDRIFKIGSNFDVDEESKQNPQPFGEYYVKKYNEKILEEFGNNKEILDIAKMMQDWFQKFFCCLESLPTWNDASTTSVDVYQHCEGDQQLNWRDKGYRTILYVMMKKIPDVTKQLPLDDKIFLNKEVTRIEWDDTNVTGVTVSCSDGSSYNAEHVIITVSLGVLKQFHTELFHPKLPDYKINAIEGMFLGTVNKILLKFPTKWWPNDLKGFSLVWTEDDRKNLINEFPHGPQDNGRSWLEDIFGFYVIDSHPRVLLGWVVGKMAADVELLSDEIVISGCMLLLNKFAGHKYHIPQPDAVLRSKWKNNPHFCGSYVGVTSEAEKRGATADDLAKAVVSSNSKQTLLFAGEGTHPTYFSTVHGAIETGYREAERIINIYKEPHRQEYHKIAIVGAGMAGLGAALKFQELGCDDFVVLEAQNEPGGRIKTIEFDNRPLDLGAQWLHGKSNPLYEIAKKYNLLSEETSEEGLGKFIRNDGVVLDDYLVKRVDFEIGKILQSCQNFKDCVDHPDNLGNYLKQQFSEYLKICNDPDDIKQMKLELLDWHVRFQVIDNSCRDLTRLSAKSWGEYICEDDIAHNNLKYGYKSLVDVLVNSLPINAIIYNSSVTTIEYGNKTNGQIILHCDNKKICCDHLVMTPSLGVLKDFNFSPPLPRNLTINIKNMGYFGIGKIYLFFDYKWWDVQAFQFIWKADAVVGKDEKWMRHMTGFDEVFNQPNALLGWVGGDGVDEMEQLSEEEVGVCCLRLLRKFLPGYQIPKPTKIFRTKWSSNTWVRGSYCHITPECDSSGGGIHKLGEPVLIDGVPRILLAGEAVHPSHYSTTHGAFESGQQQAALLNEYLLTA